MKARSSNAALKAMLLGAGFLATALVWLTGPLAEKPVLAAGGADDPPLMRLTGPRGERLVLTEPLAERSALAADPAGDPGLHANPVFARKVAGTYAEVGPGYSLTINIRADGTLMWNASWFFGDGTGDYYNGSVLGSWKQTGARELTTIELGYLFNGDGSFFATGRVAEVFTFTPDFQTISYSFVEDLFAPDQDPTDPDAEPFDSFGGSGCCINRLNFMD